MEKPAIGIVCATETERDPFLARMSDVREHAHGMLVAYEGRLSGTDVFLVFSGIGKVNAAIATQTLIDSFGAGVVVNAGRGSTSAISSWPTGAPIMIWTPRSCPIPT